MSRFVHTYSLVVEPARKYSHLVVEDFIHQTVLLIHSSRLTSSQFVFERFRLTESGKWFALNLTQ